ncbi:hypothetical protein [Singulisphaera sp. PoT]|uniref:hypothetical protein n=1 Tax=Singulisphaera sp. PoT TaxID=3411797 RepID=UPI003BF5FF4C
MTETLANNDATMDRLRNSLQALYAEVDAEIARLAPVCKLSGRCCRFVEYDHTLFMSEVEATLLIEDAPPPVRPLDQGATCPWQDHRGHCTARQARPLGCRVYFCDPAYEYKAPELSERFLSDLRRITTELEFDWNYSPLHAHLDQAARDGRFPSRGD